MNKIFKVIWSKAKHCYVVASELAKSHSKSKSSRTIRKSIAALGIAVAVYVASGSAIAENNGGFLDQNTGNYTGNSNFTVTIDSDVTGNVYGRKSTSGNDVEEASVTITNGIVSKNVYGGYVEDGTGSASYNIVNISGGTVVGYVYGGHSYSGNAASNSVNISGGTFGSDSKIYAGYVSNSNNSSLTFDKDYISGTMTLFQSDTDNNFNGIKLKYNDNEAVTISDSGNIVKSATNQTLQSKGVKLTYDFEHSVSRSDSDKKVNFTALNTFKEAELGSMKWSDGGYTFANTDVIDANGLVVSFADNFKVEGAEDKNEGDSLDLLDLSSITGATINEAIARTKTLTYDKNPTSAASLTLSLSQADSIETNADKNKVTYTIGTKNVTKATFDKELVWNTSQPFYDASNSGYTFDSNTAIDAKNLNFALSDNQKAALKTNDTMTLISASGITDSNSITQPDNYTFQLSRTGNSGTKFDGTAEGAVFAETSAVKYKINKIETDKITLGSRSWSANSESLPDTWTAKTGMVIDASDFAFTTKAETVLASGDTRTLVAGSGIVGGSNIADKTVGIDYTDNSLKLGATAFGKIETITDAVQFKVDSVALDSVDISGWKSTDDVSAVPDVWGASANGVNISGFFADPGLSYGESKNILTASTAIFKDEKIDESIRYAVGSFNNALENGVSHSGVQTGGVKATDGGKTLTYYAMEKTIDKFDLADWDGENAVSVPINWKINDGASVETDGMSNLPGSDEEKQVFILKSDTEGYFANVAINGENEYRQMQFTDSDEAKSVVLDMTQKMGVTLDDAKTNLVYKVGSKDVTSLKLNSVLFKDGAELLNRDKYNYSKLTSLDTDAFNITFEKPETITVNQSMTLLNANDTLTDIAAIEKSNAYSYSPVSGVTMDAIILSRLEAKSGKVALTAFSNKADKLTFGDVEWLDKGALIEHKTLLNNVSFDGAAVDTTKIAFTNKQKLDADMQMTLVSDFGDSVGTITGDKYKVGTAYEGEGSAYLDGSDLKFKI